MILPPMLEPGDRVALLTPAGPADQKKIDTAVERCRGLGVEPVLGAAVHRVAGYLAGSDAERAADLTAALAGDAAAIWAIRGGYGSMRTLQHVDLTPLARHPRVFIGFSDNTAIHLALLRLGVVSFHGPHAGYAHFPVTTEAAFRQVLMADGATGPLPMPPGTTPLTLAPGVAEGPLVGGNLSLIAALCGTPYQPDLQGAILFLEDVGEPLYRIDRTLAQLRLAGLLDGIAGLAIGDFTAMPEPVHRAEADGEPSLEALFAETADRIGVPAVMGLPFGHGRENWTLPIGVRARLDASAGTIDLLERATTRRRSVA